MGHDRCMTRAASHLCSRTLGLKACAALSSSPQAVDHAYRKHHASVTASSRHGHGLWVHGYGLRACSGRGAFPTFRGYSEYRGDSALSEQWLAQKSIARSRSTSPVCALCSNVIAELVTAQQGIFDFSAMRVNALTHARTHTCNSRSCIYRHLKFKAIMQTLRPSIREGRLLVVPRPHMR